MRFVIASLAALALLQISSAVAQTATEAPPVRLRGVIQAIDDTALTMRTRDGQTVKVAVPAGLVVGAVEARKLSDIKPNDFVGTTAVPGKDGRLIAEEVHIFPEAMRGTGEGHYAWDQGVTSTMTNAAVAGMAAAPSGQRLTLKYKDGQSEIEVPNSTPIVGMIPGDRTLLKPGATVFLIAAQGADRTLTARRAVAEKAGVKPPM